MANTARDLIKCSISNAPGTTGDFTLAAAAANSLMPVAGDDGLKFKLNITQNGVGTEIRKDCTYTHSSTSFSRGTMVRSTGTADAALNFTSAAIVRVVPSAEDFLTTEQAASVVSLVSGAGNYAVGQFRYLPVLQNAYAATRAGTADTIIAVIGDSTVAGLYANGVQTAGNRPYAPPVVLGNLMAASSLLGLPVSQDSTFGLGINLAGVTTYDPRITFTSANWGTSGLQWLGGNNFRNDTNESSSMNVAFAQTFDTITVYYYVNTGLGSFNISVDGGATLGATVDTNGASALASVTRTCASGTYTVNITRVAEAKTVLIFGVVASHSTTKRVMVFNWGNSGTATADWILTSEYNLGTAGPAMNPHCVFIKLGINDALADVAPATYATNLQTMIDQYKPTSDVVLVTPNPINVAQVTYAKQYALYQKVRNLAQINGLPLIDINAMYGTWIAGVASGYFGPLDDQVHPSDVGYAAEAAQMAALVGANGGL